MTDHGLVAHDGIVVMTAKALAQVHRARLFAAQHGRPDVDEAAETILAALAYQLRKPQAKLPISCEPAWNLIHSL